ncbi:DUF4214 domain-containing protein, partial [Limimaricola pyoseonensis]
PSTPSIGVEGLAGEATILDDDTTPGPVVSIAAAANTESSLHYLTFVVRLSEAAADAVSFNYRTLAGTAEDEDLYHGLNSTATSGQLSFAPGETTKEIVIRISGDSLDERDESVVMQLSELTPNASFAGGETTLRATGVIRDDDGTGSNLALFVSDPVLVEGDSGTREAEFEVRLSRPAEEAFSVGYATRDISALAGEDYAPRTGTLNFAIGEEVKTVRVPVFGDAAAEPTESFALVLDPPSTPSIGVEGLAGEATILDDDTTPGPVVSIAAAANTESSLHYLTFVVSLSEAASDAVSFDYRTLAGTAGDEDLYHGLNSAATSGRLSFAPGETTKEIVIRISGDNIDERDEHVVLQLSALVGGSFADGASTASALGFIRDDDGVGLETSIAVEPVITREHAVDAMRYEIPVALSRPATAELSFDVVALNQSAIAGQDYRLIDSRVTFGVGESRAAVSVDILGDGLDEATETFGLALTPVSGAPFAGNTPVGVVTILNGPRIPTPGDDRLEGTAGPDDINLLAGDDYFDGLGGNDSVRGGNGSDMIIGGAGSDDLHGEAGHDFLIGGAVANVVSVAGGQVYRLYRATLDRSPDATGYDGWTGRLEAGTHPLLSVVTGFVASREFQAVYGALNDTAFVRLLYNNVLDRAPDATGLTNWVGRLATGVTREEVVLGFSESREFKLKTLPEAGAYSEAQADHLRATYADDVFRLYQATLDRAPDVQGLGNWAGRLADGQSYVNIAGGFTNSAEFRSTYGAVDSPAFVTLLYNNVLDRNPDATGLRNWVARMDGGMSREGVVQGFAQSQELINKTAAPFAAYMASLEGDELNGGPGNDILAGSLLADTFVFDADEDGANRVLHLETWDTLRFVDFGYSEAADALDHMRAVGSGVVFSDQGVQVTFERTSLSEITTVDYLFT